MIHLVGSLHTYNILSEIYQLWCQLKGKCTHLVGFLHTCNGFLVQQHCCFARWTPEKKASWPNVWMAFGKVKDLNIRAVVGKSHAPSIMADVLRSHLQVLRLATWLAKTSSFGPLELFIEEFEDGRLKANSPISSLHTYIVVVCINWIKNPSHKSTLWATHMWDCVKILERRW